MPRRPPTSNPAYRLISKAIVVLAPIFGAVFALLDFLSEAPPGGPLGRIFALLWGQWPLWSHLFTVPAGVALLLLLGRFGERPGPPPEDPEALKRALETQGQATSAYEGLYHAQKIVFEKLAEDYPCLAVESGLIRDEHDKLDRDFTITWKMMDDLCRMMDQACQDSLGEATRDYNLTIAACPSLGLDEREAAAALASGFHEVGAAPTEPRLWIVHHAFAQVRKVVGLVSRLQVLAISPGVFHEVIAQSPGLGEEEIVARALEHPRIVEFLKRGSEARENLARVKSQLESRTNHD